MAATPGRGNATLRAACNVSVLGRQCFRAKHLEYAARYIHQPSERATANPAGVGTGGTPFMSYLKKHCDETEAHLIR